MDWIVIVGVLASLCSTASFTPQAWKIIRSRSTEGLSTGMYAITVAGFALWFTYGIGLDQWPLIVTNGICLAFSTFILVMTMLPKPTTQQVAETLDPVGAPEKA